MNKVEEKKREEKRREERKREEKRKMRNKFRFVDYIGSHRARNLRSSADSDMPRIL